MQANPNCLKLSYTELLDVCEKITSNVTEGIALAVEEATQDES